MIIKSKLLIKEVFISTYILIEISELKKSIGFLISIFLIFMITIIAKKEFLNN